MILNGIRGSFPLVGMLALSSGAAAQSDTEALAKQLSNPVASLITVPFQLNFDDGLGPDGSGQRTTLNLQPVVPISLGENWNLISRTIVPIIDQKDVIPGTSQSGVGDIVQSFFFSPKAPTAEGLIWGAGPVFLFPTHSAVSGEQFAAGITGVMLKQTGPWTLGFLGNHLVSVGGNKDIDSTFAQPFVTYTTPDAWTFGVNTEAVYDWNSDEASVPINLTASKVTRIGDQLVSIGGGLRYWIDTPTGGPDGLALRLQVNLLFPK